MALPPGRDRRRGALRIPGRVDALVEASLERGAKSEVDRMIRRSQGDAPVMLTLAEELLDRGRTIDGINLGWALRREGHAHRASGSAAARR